MSKPLFFVGLLMFFAAGCVPADRSSASCLLLHLIDINSRVR